MALFQNSSSSSAIPTTTRELLARITDPYGVYCVLELRMPSKLLSGMTESIFHFFPVMPESLAVAQRYLQTITPTQGGAFVDDYGRAPSPVILTGTFGRSPKIDVVTAQEALLKNSDVLQVRADQVALANRRPSGGPVTGYKLVKLLSEMVELSHVPDPKTGELPQAFFYNFGFGQFYEVALTGFQAQMDVDRNGLWLYELQMTLLKRINDGPTDSIPKLKLGEGPDAIYQRSQKLAKDRITELRRASNPAAERISRRSGGLLSSANRLRLQKALDTVQRGRQLVSRANGFVSAVRTTDVLAFGGSLLDKALGLRPGTVLSLYDTVRQLPNIARELENIARQTSKRIPSELAAELKAAREAVNVILPAVEKQVSLINAQQEGAANSAAREISTVLYDEGAAEIMALGEIVLTAQDQLGSIDTFLEMYGLTDAPSTSSSAVFSVTPMESAGPASDTYIIRQGDTLLSIARNAYGDENAWTMISAALPAQYRDWASTESLNALIGTVIQLPQVNAEQAPLIPYVWDSPNGVRALGRDLPDTLQVRVRDDGTKELVVLPEYDTLLQGLLHRLQTPLGSIPDDQTFGSDIPSLIGQDFGMLTNPMNEAKAAEALRQDPRLIDVSNVFATQDQDTLEIGFAAKARNAGSLGFVNLSISRQTP